jgi:hypothetical protein
MHAHEGILKGIFGVFGILGDAKDGSEKPPGVDRMELVN